MRLSQHELDQLRTLLRGVKVEIPKLGGHKGRPGKPIKSFVQDVGGEEFSTKDGYKTVEVRSLQIPIFGSS
jgi:hypothetical protein